MYNDLFWRTDRFSIFREVFWLFKEKVYFRRYDNEKKLRNFFIKKNNNKKLGIEVPQLPSGKAPRD